MLNTAYHAVLQAIVLAQAEAPAGAPAGGADGAAGTASPGSSMWIFLIGMVAIMYFFMMRPQQKKEKERQKMLSSLSKGDRVVTRGGLMGSVVGLTEKKVVLRVCENPPTKIEFARSAVQHILSKDEEKEDKNDVEKE